MCRFAATVMRRSLTNPFLKNRGGLLFQRDYISTHICVVDDTDDTDSADAGNGKIDFREFLLLVRNYERPLPEDVEVREMFNALDKDKNGYIDRDELKTSFAGLGITLSDNDVAEMMAEADVYADRIYFEGCSPFIIITITIIITIRIKR